MAVVMIAVLVALPVSAAEYALANPQLPEVLVVADATGHPREATRILLEVLQAGAYRAVKVYYAEDLVGFRAAVRGASAPFLVLVADGEPNELRVGRQSLSWPELRSDLAASDARNVVFMMCFSENAGAPEGMHVLKAYPGEVDLEIAALDAAYEIGRHALSGHHLAAFAAAHTAYVYAHGGPERALQLLLEPSRTLGGEDCASQWNAWRYGSPDGKQDCRTMKIEQDNHSCAKSGACKSSPAQQQKQEEEIEKSSSGQFQDRFFAILERFSLAYDVCFQNYWSGRFTYYDWYLSIGRDLRSLDECKGFFVLEGGSELCYEIADISDLVMPYMKVIEEVTHRVPGLTFEFDGFVVEVCASIGGGILRGGNQDEVKKGNLDGNLDFRGVTGIKLRFSIWWITVDFVAEVTVAYPLGVNADLTWVRSSGLFRAELTLGMGPLRIELQTNLFDIYWSADVPFTSYKTNPWVMEWTFSADSPMGERLRLQAASLQGGEPAMPDPVSDMMLRHLPPGTVRIHAPQEVARPLPHGGKIYPVADVLELRPGDAFFNHLALEGKLAKLGIASEGVQPGQSVYLDLANPEVYEALYDAPSPRPRTVAGLPGGATLAPSTCAPASLGLAVVVDVTRCDPSKPVLGWEGTLEAVAPRTDAVAGVDVVPAVSEPPLVSEAKKEHVHSAEQAVDATTGLLCIDLGRGAFSGQPAGELCQWLRHELSYYQVADPTRKALEAHQVKVLLEQLGVFAWLTDACELPSNPAAPETALVRMRELNMCIDLLEPLRDPKVGLDGPQQQLPRLSEVALNFTLGIDEIGNTSELIVGPHIDWWTKNEPGTIAIGREIQAVAGGPIGDVGRAFNEKLCEGMALVPPLAGGC